MGFGFIIPALLVLSENFDVNLNDSGPAITLFGISLQNWYKYPDIFNKYYYIVLNYTFI